MPRVTAILALVAGLLAAPAHAQLASGYSGFSSAPRLGTTDEFWFSLQQLGGCFAKSKARESRALLATEPSSPAEAAAAREMLGRYTSCLQHSYQMVASTNLVRGAIAEGLYKREVAVPPAPVEVPRPAAADRNDRESLAPYRVLAQFSRCFAAKHPQRVHRIVTETKLGSKEAHAAIAALEPFVPECLPPNVKIVFEPTDIRLSLVEALYHRSRTVTASREGNR